LRGKAFTRQVSPKLAQCELTHLERVPIDAARAREQHAAYERALSAFGMEIVRLPDLPDDPDGVFVEDTALILDGHAIITRPGAASRADEVGSTAAGLAGQFELHRIGRGHLDGGDVLRIGKRLYVGLSSRTDSEGVAELRDKAAPLGFDVAATELGDCLHLKTAATLAGVDRAGRAVLIYNPLAIDPRQFAEVDAMAVADAEPGAANVLWAGGGIIMAAGNPRTADALRSRGLEVVELNVSELEKAEAGVTCMSLISEEKSL
jgi:dimethylargininase